MSYGVNAYGRLNHTFSIPKFCWIECKLISLRNKHKNFNFNHQKCEGLYTSKIEMTKMIHITNRIESLEFHKNILIFFRISNLHYSWVMLYWTYAKKHLRKYFPIFLQIILINHLRSFVQVFCVFSFKNHDTMEGTILLRSCVTIP